MSNIAQTIYQQLGGNGFAMVTGAKSFVSSDDSLTFQLRRGGICKPKNKAAYVRITLSQTDTYGIEFLKLNNKTLEVSTISKHDGVYADGLTEVFENETGLVTSL